MALISGGKLQQIDLKNKQQDNIPVMGIEKNGNLLDSCNYLDDNRDSYQLGIREEVIMKTIFLILILLMPLTAIADESFVDYGTFMGHMGQGAFYRLQLNGPQKGHLGHIILGEMANWGRATLLPSDNC